jgi:hypothetical protein
MDGGMKSKYQNAATFGIRQKMLAKLFLDGKSVEEIAASRGCTWRHIAGEICFGALLLRDEDARARKLHELFSKPGIGVTKAIQRYQRELK